MNISIDELIEAGHVIQLGTNNYVKYSGLVAIAHMKGIKGIKTEILLQDVKSDDRLVSEEVHEEQLDNIVQDTDEIQYTKVKTIIKTIKACRVMVRATVFGKEGQEYTSIATATEYNLKKNMLPYLYEMAETRAKARALRDFVGIGLTAWEELPDYEPEAKPQPKRVNF